MGGRLIGWAMVAPAGAMVACLFAYPLLGSLIGAFTPRDAAQESFPSLANFAVAWEFYADDMVFTVGIIALSVAITGVLAVAIAGYLTLGTTPFVVAALRWLYRWPLFIPFIVAAQCMRTFLAKNGLMNNALSAGGLITPLEAQSFLDWRGIVITMVWKQLPFVTLLVAGAMAALDRSTIEAARNLGAGKLRVLLQIVVPQVTGTLGVALVLTTVVMTGVLSVPIMMTSQTPAMLTVQMAFRINAYGDYGTANALGVVSYLITGSVSWLYLRHVARGRSR
ncbi:MAG: ABC transporter permease [Alphaproteobacteria bacterium]